MIRFGCPKCKTINQHSETLAGQIVACSSCAQKLRVPAANTAVSKLPPPIPPLPQKEQIDVLEEVPDRDEEPLDVVEEVRQPAARRIAKSVDTVDMKDAIADAGREKSKSEKPSAVLGPKKATFEPRKELLQMSLILFAVSAVAGLIFLVLGIVSVMPDSGVALSVFTLPTGIFGFLWCRSVLSLKVVVHEGGLAHTHKGKRRLILWSQILSVKQAITEHYTDNVYTNTTYKYTLELDDGTKIVYTNYRVKKVDKLGDEIIEKTSAVLLPQAMRRYEMGEVVNFGPLGVSQDGLHYGESLLEWKGIKEVKIKEGYISVSKRGKWLRWCNIAAASISNLSVFLAMVHDIIGVAGVE